MMTHETPAKRSRMSAIVVANMSSPSGNWRATDVASSCRRRQILWVGGNRRRYLRDKPPARLGRLLRHDGTRAPVGAQAARCGLTRARRAAALAHTRETRATRLRPAGHCLSVPLGGGRGLIFFLVSEGMI
eukprot:scaffold3183_cov120-Isochrysis_galbana.AAC.5